MTVGGNSCTSDSYRHYRTARRLLKRDELLPQTCDDFGRTLILRSLWTGDLLERRGFYCFLLFDPKSCVFKGVRQAFVWNRDREIFETNRKKWRNRLNVFLFFFLTQHYSRSS